MRRSTRMRRTLSSMRTRSLRRLSSMRIYLALGWVRTRTRAKTSLQRTWLRSFAVSCVWYLADDGRRDYTTNAALDTYDYRNLDETEQAEMTVEQRQAVEARLARRDRREQGQAAPEGARRRRQRAPAFLLSDDDHDPALEEERLLRGGDRRRNWYDERPQADQDPNTYEVCSCGALIVLITANQDRTFLWRT